MLMLYAFVNMCTYVSAIGYALEDTCKYMHSCVCVCVNVCVYVCECGRLFCLSIASLSFITGF